MNVTVYIIFFSVTRLYKSALVGVTGSSVQKWESGIDLTGVLWDDFIID